MQGFWNFLDKKNELKLKKSEEADNYTKIVTFLMRVHSY